MSFEDVTGKLQKMLDGGRLHEAETRLAELAAAAAYVQRCKPAAVTFRCGIREKSGPSCGKPAGHLFETPNGLVFTVPGRGPDDLPDQIHFIYDSGYLFISAPRVFGPAPKPPKLIAGAPFARCGKHGPYFIAPARGAPGRDIREFLNENYARRGRVPVYPAGGNPAHPVNAATGQLGADLGPLTRTLLGDQFRKLDDDPTLGYM